MTLLDELSEGWPTPEEVIAQDLRLCAVCYQYHPRKEHDEHMQSHGYTTIPIACLPPKSDA